MPRTIAHYELLDQLGAGGMGVVYRARDTQLERLVALKLLGEGDAFDQQAQGRLMREARTASVLNHPNICTIFAAGTHEGVTYIAMELVEGEPLQSIIDRGTLPIDTALAYTLQIAAALEHAHGHGIVHRDLKDANVMVTRSGQIKVLDFGLARRDIAEHTRSIETVTQTGMIAGTIPYMAPEVLEGKPASACTDLWALGVILYRALSQRLPFTGATPFTLTSAIQRDEPAPLPPQVPAPVASIVNKLLAKDPAARYQSARELITALTALHAPPRPARGLSRKRFIWITASIVGVGAAAAWFGMQRFAGTPPGPRLSDGGRPSPIREANDYYERALVFGTAGPRHDPPQLRRMLERAIEIDPKFAQARAQFAFARMIFVLQGDSSDSALLYSAEEEARRALRDDPTCGLAHSVLAGTNYLRGRKDLVMNEFRAARKAGADDPAVRQWMTLFHWSNGDYDAALRNVHEILNRWPLFWPGHVLKGELLRELGDLAGAVRAQEVVLEQDPQSRVALAARARGCMEDGDLPKARQTLERIRPEDRKNARVRINRALLSALEGKPADARREIDADVLGYASNSFRGPLLAAEIYAVLGDTSAAFDWLDRAARMGDDRADWLRRDPFLRSLRPDPRFQQLVASADERRKQRPPAPN